MLRSYHALSVRPFLTYHTTGPFQSVHRFGWLCVQVVPELDQLSDLHWPLIGLNAKQNALDIFQDRAVLSASRRYRRKLAEEMYGTAEESMEAVSVDQLAHVGSAPGGGEN